MALELYLDLLSQPCRSVYIFAKKNNIPFEYKNVSLLDGEQYAEDFGKINPVRKAPALRDGDFCLSESVAILMYMAEKFKTPEFWYPHDLQKSARINEYLSWQHTAIWWHGYKLFWLRVLIPKIMDMEIPKEKLDMALEDLEGSLNLIEEKFLQDRLFIAGEQISLADLVAIVDIMQPVGFGLDVFQGRPKLSAWRDRVKIAIGEDLFDEAHKDIMAAHERMKTYDATKLQHFKHRVQRFL